MENKIPPMPPKRPFIQKSEVVQKTEVENKEQAGAGVRNANIQPKPNNMTKDNTKVETQGQGEGKKKFELNSQTKAFILFFAAFFCLAGAIACFIFLFI